jgi:hypothetical protein
MSQEDFTLDAPATNNYANMILMDMRNYKYWADRRYDMGVHIQHGETALNHLISDIVPKGKEFMRKAYPTMKNFGVLEIDTYLQRSCKSTEQDWEFLDNIYDKALEWLYPNILELHINVGKPAYTAEGHLGNKPR